LERQGRFEQASVTSVRNWTDPLDGVKHQTVSYQLTVGNDYYSSATDVPMRGKGYATGERLPVIYPPSRPAKAQPVNGGLATSTGLTVFVMLAMVALMLWMLSLLG
jgi:hypothetical protein